MRSLPINLSSLHIASLRIFFYSFLRTFLPGCSFDAHKRWLGATNWGEPLRTLFADKSPFTLDQGIHFTSIDKWSLSEKRLRNKKVKWKSAFRFLCWQKSQPCRIINVSSLAHRYGKIKKDDINSDKTYSEVHCYSQSKLANVLFTRELSRRLKGTRITVNALHPGTINTELTRSIDHMTILFNKFLVKPFLFLFFKTAKAGAQTTLYAGKFELIFNETFLINSFQKLSALDPLLDNVSGQYFSWVLLPC